MQESVLHVSIGKNGKGNVEERRREGKTEKGREEGERRREGKTERGKGEGKSEEVTFFF